VDFDRTIIAKPSQAPEVASASAAIVTSYPQAVVPVRDRELFFDSQGVPGSRVVQSPPTPCVSYGNPLTQSTPIDVGIDVDSHHFLFLSKKRKSVSTP
jgi:hypothetical protein